mmetsp:Transcript_29147/g.52123  ORF Transcript_29147/g.52123 Transcript_29147/m.52123 type:complete len:382 (-) Transcript_29147:155-1300(-)
MKSVADQNLLDFHGEGRLAITQTIGSIKRAIATLSTQDDECSIARVIQYITQDFRCKLSKHFMLTPALASDGNVYDLTSLRVISKASDWSPSSEDVLAMGKPKRLVELQNKIKDFCISMIGHLDSILAHEVDESALDVITECLYVLIFHRVNISPFLDKLKAIEPSQIMRLISTLNELLKINSKLSLLRELLKVEEFLSAACVVFHGLLQNKGDRLSDKEFRKLIGMLMKCKPLQHLVSIPALAANCRDTTPLKDLQDELSLGIALDSTELIEFSLRRAEMLLHDAKYGEAWTILAELQPDPDLKGLLLKFYDRFGLISEKKRFLQETLAGYLTELVGQTALDGFSNILELTDGLKLLPNTYPMKQVSKRKHRSQSHQYKL